MRRSKVRSESGAVLIAALFLAVVVALISGWYLSSSQTALKRAGHFRSHEKLLYLAEEGIQKAARRIQSIASWVERDSLYSQGLYGGGNPTNDKTLGNFLLLIPKPSEVGVQQVNRKCPEPFDPGSTNQELDSWTKTLPDTTTAPTNVICNFMGSSLEDTQIILVRQEDFPEGNLQAAVYLLNSFAVDETGRRALAQGVVIVPYWRPDDISLISQARIPHNLYTYLATTLKRHPD